MNIRTAREKMENQDILIINNRWFQYIEWKEVKRMKGGMGSRTLCKMKSLTKSQVDKIKKDLARPVGKSINNSYPVTSDGLKGEGA